MITIIFLSFSVILTCLLVKGKCQMLNAFQTENDFLVRTVSLIDHWAVMQFYMQEKLNAICTFCIECYYLGLKRCFPPVQFFF